MPHLLALDQGTTSSRAIVFNEAGDVVSLAQAAFPQIFPQPGWVEHDPETIWQSQSDVAGRALVDAGIDRSDIHAIGITNQRETTIIWDRATGEPIANAIVWQDRRTTRRCEDLRAAGVEPTFTAKTGLLLDPYFSGTKIAWLLDHVPGARDRAERGELAFGTVDTWLAWKLTGGSAHVTDVTNASRTLLFNLHTGTWDDELLDLLKIPRALLPEIVSSCEVIGEVTGLDPLNGCMIASLLGDQQAATLGQGCVEPGLAKCTYGTGCFMLVNTGTAKPATSAHRLLSTLAWRYGAMTTYALEGSVFVGGAIVQWLRDGLGLIEDASEIASLATEVDDAGGVILVPALSGLGAPHWDPHARGMMIGLTRGTTRAHIARAALDGIAFQVADLADIMAQDAATTISEIRVDGGACQNDLLMQRQADLVQRPIVRTTMIETTAWGAAFAAGLATGLFRELAELQSLRTVDRTFEPEISETDAAAARARWNDAVARCQGWSASDP